MDTIERELKKLTKQNDRIIVLLETLVTLTGGSIATPEPAPAPTPAEIRRDVTVVPRGRITPRFTPDELQRIHPSERERYR